MISRSFSGIGKQERHCMSHLSCSNGRFNGQGVSGGTVLLLCADSVGWVVQQHSSMGTEVGRKEARRSWTFSHVGLEVKEWRKSRSIYFFSGALKFPCSGLRSKSLQFLSGRGTTGGGLCKTLPPWEEKSIMCINTGVLQPVDRTLGEGRLLGSCQLPKKFHILLPPRVTEIYEAARLRYSFSISITSTLTPCWHVLGPYLCCWSRALHRLWPLTVASVVKSTLWLLQLLNKNYHPKLNWILSLDQKLFSCNFVSGFFQFLFSTV